MSDEINWQEKLLPEEIGEEDKGGRKTKFVLLKGLRRLSRLKGEAREAVHFGNAFAWETAKHGTIPFVQMSYEIEYKDGSRYVGAADAHFFNIPDPSFSIYPTAICESRAEARAKRKALGIDLVSKEELGSVDGGYEMTGKIKPEQITLIKRLMKKKNIDNSSNLFKTIGARSDVVTIDEMNFEEAHKAIKYLNEEIK